MTRQRKQIKKVANLQFNLRLEWVLQNMLGYCSGCQNDFIYGRVFREKFCSVYALKCCWLDRCHNCHNSRSCLRSTTNVNKLGQTSHGCFTWEWKTSNKCHKLKLKKKQACLHVSGMSFYCLIIQLISGVTKMLCSLCDQTILGRH